MEVSQLSLNLTYQILNTLNDGEIPPELELFNGGPNPRFEQIINDLGINQDSRNF